MKIFPFLAYTATGTGMWAALLAYLGYFLGSEYAQVSEYLDPISWIVFGAVGVLYFVRAIGHKGQSKERTTTYKAIDSSGHSSIFTESPRFFVLAQYLTY